MSITTIDTTNMFTVWMWELDHKRKLSAEELKLLNYSVGEDSWESFALQDQTS